MKSTGTRSTILVSKHRYSFEPGNLISLRSSILIKVHILYRFEQSLINPNICTGQQQIRIEHE